jgi:hypothetical protein
MSIKMLMSGNIVVTDYRDIHCGVQITGQKFKYFSIEWHTAIGLHVLTKHAMLYTQEDEAKFLEELKVVTEVKNKIIEYLNR